MTYANTIKRGVPAALLTALVAGMTPAVVAAGPASFTATSAASATHGKGGAAVRPPYSARLAGCRRSLSIDARIATVAAAMRPIAGGKRLALRVDLAQRPLAGGRWTLRTDVPGLGAWTSPSDPTIGTRPADVFKYRQAVGRLVVGFSYRFRVGFRWLDSAGAIVRAATSVTRPCREPDLRPDLLLPRVRTAIPPQHPNRVRYSVTVRNDGRTTAHNVVVAATFAGGPAPGATRTVARLRPRHTATVTFPGPPCRAGVAPPTFVVDPANAIDELDETNDQLVVACPAT